MLDRCTLPTRTIIRRCGSSFHQQAASATSQATTLRFHSSSTQLLHYDTIGPISDSSTIFLHGALGNGKNLRSISQKLSKSSILFDLRGHGGSSDLDFQPPHTFGDCVDGIRRTLQSEGLHVDPETVVGHSFGGRLALHYAHALANVDDSNLRTTWLLDTVPGVINESVTRVVEVIESVPIDEMKSKKDVLNALLEGGLEQGIAQWLSTSVRTIPQYASGKKALRWGFNLEVLKGLLAEFGNHDFMAMIEETCGAQPQRHMHLVRAGKNKAWELEILSKLQQMESRLDNFHVHVLPKADHWVHIDDPEGLTRIYKSFHLQS